MKALSTTESLYHVKADVISIEQENVLWEKGLLRDKSLPAVIRHYDFLYQLVLRSSVARSIDDYGINLRLSYVLLSLLMKHYTWYIWKIYMYLRLINVAWNTQREANKVIQCAYLNPHSCIARLYKLYVSYCPVDQPDHAF